MTKTKVDEQARLLLKHVMGGGSSRGWWRMRRFTSAEKAEILERCNELAVIGASPKGKRRAAKVARETEAATTDFAWGYGR